MLVWALLLVGLLLYGLMLCGLDQLEGGKEGLHKKSREEKVCPGSWALTGLGLLPERESKQESGNDEMM